MEFDLINSLVLGVNTGDEEDLDSFFQPFVYEKILKFYFKCGRVCHQINACSFIFVPQQEVNAGNSASSSSHLSSEDNLESEMEMIYGP